MQNKNTFTEIIPEIISKFASNSALGFIDEKPVTYAEFGIQIKAVIALTERLGIEPGDKVAILSTSIDEKLIIRLNHCNFITPKRKP